VTVVAHERTRPNESVAPDPHTRRPRSEREPQRPRRSPRPIEQRRRDAVDRPRRLQETHPRRQPMLSRRRSPSATGRSTRPPPTATSASSAKRT